MISDDQINKVLEKINKTPVAYAYFFNNINNPAWLVPLKEKGFFKNPTPAIRQDGYIQFPVWPESGYLARIADRAEDEVLAIIKDLPDTDNERVMDDVVNALLKIDPTKAAQLTEKVKLYVNSSQYLLLNQSASELVCKLAEAGKVGAALALSKEMLEVFPDPQLESKLKEQYVMIKASTKYRNYDYKDILEKVTPSLAAAAPLATIDLYADLLHNAIAYEFTHWKENKDEEVKVEEKKDDISWIWRPQIANNNENNDDPENVLTTALRDTVLALLQNTSISDVDKKAKLQSLIDRNFYIFKRIVEFTLRDYKDTATFKPIYDSLLSDDKLMHILENEKNDHGVIESGFITETPTNVLKDLPDEKLIETLKVYKGEDQWAFERESIAKELTELIRLDPKRFVTLISDIAGTKNEYLSEAIRVLIEVVDSLDEDDIVKLTTSLTDIYRADIATQDKERHDYYLWSKASTIDLAEKLLSQKDDKSERITAKSLSSVTNLLLHLCRDKDPSGNNDPNFDPLNLSINSTRGKAMNALAYLLTYMNRTKVDKILFKPVFDELDWHLKPANDPVAAIRVVYGWRFALLYGIDEKWAKNNINKIFSEDELGNTAFDAYVIFNSVHLDEIKILEDVLKRQLTRLTITPTEDSKARHDGLKNFVQRLALHYWYGDIDLADGSLMDVLLKTGDAKYIKELANFVGFRLYKSKGAEIEEAEITKLIALWEAIVDISQEDTTKIIALEEFGTWFASGKFDANWSLEQLFYAASKAKNIFLDYAALEYLETLAPEHPDGALKALSAMVDNTRERWAISSWSKNAISVLRIAYNSSDDNTRQASIDLANKLVAKGYTEYREVIS